MTSIVQLPCHNLGDCSCSPFVTETGYGNCQKPTRNEPEKGPICYVNTPTTCSDVIDEDSRAPTGYSWDACNNHKGNFLFYHTPKQIFLC